MLQLAGSEVDKEQQQGHAHNTVEQAAPSPLAEVASRVSLQLEMDELNAVAEMCATSGAVRRRARYSVYLLYWHKSTYTDA
jgi:hypothetical protein